MSQTPSPYSRPDPFLPPQSGPSRNMVAIVAILSMTILLLCGGVIGLGFYAVDRLAEQISEFADDFADWDNEEAAVALEFAIEENEIIRDRVGEIELVESDSDLTYDVNAGAEDYYFRVTGTSGDATLVVQFADDEHRWFKSVELVHGEGLGDTRTMLESRHAPFDSQWSKRVYDVLVTDDESVAQSLNIGAVQWISYDYERYYDEHLDTELVFEISGDSGKALVVARFNDRNFVEVQSIDLIDEEGKKQQSIYVAETVEAGEETPEPAP